MIFAFARNAVTALCILLCAGQAGAQTLTVQTVAGAPTGSVDQPGTAALFNGPAAVALDSAGNAYIADSFNNTIRRVTPSGFVSTLAGAAPTSGFSDGTNASALFNSPFGLCVDGSGNVYVADSGNNTIRKITPAGVVTTLAGSALSPAGSLDGNGQAARFNFPTAVAADSSGNVFVADSQNHTIRKITPSGDVTTVAGMAGVPGSADGKGTARFFGPAGIAVAASGNIYVADKDNFTIRRIAADGTVTTLAGSAGTGGSSDGTGAAASFIGPQGLAVDSAENIYVADSGNETIRKVTSGGVVTTLAGVVGPGGDLDGPAASALFFDPQGVAVDGQGNVLVADRFNNAIRKISSLGAVTTLAGPVNVTTLLNPTGVAAGADGSVYIAENGNSVVRKIAPDGTVSILAGQIGVYGFANFANGGGIFNQPFGVAVDSFGDVFVTDTNNALIRGIASNGKVITVAGQVGKKGSKDGARDKALFNRPQGIAIGPDGNVYVSDTDSHTIRKISGMDFSVTTFAGKAGSSGFTDGAGKLARFHSPVGLVFDPVGDLFVADAGNRAIRRIAPDGTVSTVTGAPSRSGSDDGPLATASFEEPAGVALDALGNGYVADKTAQTIRMVTAATVSTPAGLADNDGASDGTGTFARFLNPVGLAFAPNGTLYIADTDNNLIRSARPGLADAATIDRSFASVNQLRQLNVLNQSATTFKWRVLLRPASSVVDFSNASIANPTFTPDAAGSYKFELFASSSAGVSITRLRLEVLATPVVADLFDSRDDPGFLNGTVRFFLDAISANASTLTYTVDFGDATAAYTTSVPDSTFVQATHVYTVPGEYTVTFTATDGFNPFVTTLHESVPAPNSGAAGVLNISTNKDDTTNPANGIKLGVNASNGGVIQVRTNLDDSITSSIVIKTDFGNFSGRSDIVLNSMPVHKFLTRGIYVATTRTSDVTTGNPIGMARKMIAIGDRETGDLSSGLGVAPATELTPLAMKGTFFFSGGKSDTISFTGSFLLPPKLDPFAPHALSFGIGNVISDTMIDATGKNTNAGTPAVLKSVKVMYKGVKKGALAQGGEVARISAEVSVAGLVAAGFDTEGITQTSTTPGKSVPRMIQVAVLIEGVAYQALVPVQVSISNGGDFGTLQGRR